MTTKTCTEGAHSGETMARAPEATCMSCGHSGEHITDKRGFCTACGNLPSRKVDPAGGVPLAVRDAGGAMPAMPFFVATMATLVHWTFLYGFSLVLNIASSVPAAFLGTPIAGANPWGAFNVGVKLGGVVATVIFWFMAYKRQPFLGVALGVAGGAVASLSCWVLASFF